MVAVNQLNQLFARRTCLQASDRVMYVDRFSLLNCGGHFTVRYEPAELPLEDDERVAARTTKLAGATSRKAERVRLEGEVRTQNRESV